MQSKTLTTKEIRATFLCSQMWVSMAQEHGFGSLWTPDSNMEAVL